MRKEIGHNIGQRNVQEIERRNGQENEKRYDERIGQRRGKRIGRRIGKMIKKMIGKNIGKRIGKRIREIMRKRMGKRIGKSVAKRVGQELQMMSLRGRKVGTVSKVNMLSWRCCHHTKRLDRIRAPSHAQGTGRHEQNIGIYY
jgi:hypothetical protein